MNRYVNFFSTHPVLLRIAKHYLQLFYDISGTFVSLFIKTNFWQETFHVLSHQWTILILYQSSAFKISTTFATIFMSNYHFPNKFNITYVSQWICSSRHHLAHLKILYTVASVQFWHSFDSIPNKKTLNIASL